MLHQEGILQSDEYRLLADGYLFLRRLDHRLRLERDQSIDAFEANPERPESVARALGYNGAKKQARGVRTQPGEKLLVDYQQWRERIRACYERFFSLAHAKDRTEESTVSRG